MKKLMKYAMLPRALVLLLALTLAVTASVLPAAAAADKVYTEWVYDEATKTLTATFPDGDTEVYYRVEDSIHLRYDPDYSYKYYRSVRIDGSSYEIFARGEEGDTLALLGFHEDWLFFVTEKEMDQVQELFEADPDCRVSVSYSEADNQLHHNMDKNFLKDLRELTADPEAETLTDTLYGLRYAPRFELWMYNGGFMVAVNEGFLFDLAGEMYYASVRDLPAAAFDGEGKLIPSESVTVTLYRLPEELEADAYYAVYTASTHYTWSVEHEGGYMGGLLDPDLSDEDLPVGLVYFTIAFLGIIAPIAPLVLGLCLPHSAKQGYKKRWYLLAYLGGAWMVMGVVLLVAMIVAL
ncbi:MAG: hypothetical protein J6M42_08600 [Clostridia bacterium]|nr:hypothetical protein [Clostridia bacterium]